MSDKPKLPFGTPDAAPQFDGSDYVPTLDHQRLGKQALRVFNVIADGEWWTLGQIAGCTGDPEASVSAQLRHFRKRRFGSHVIERRRVDGGLWQYRLVIPENSNGPSQG